MYNFPYPVLYSGKLLEKYFPPFFNFCHLKYEFQTEMVTDNCMSVIVNATKIANF